MAASSNDLLIQGCSDKKQDGEMAAFELYDGCFYQILKKAKREDAFRSSIDIVILSAEYGLLDPTEVIEWYDRKMTADRAATFREQGLPDEVAAVIEGGGYDRVIVNLGETYSAAIRGFESNVSASVFRLSGRLGERSPVLKRIVRTDEADPELLTSEP